MVQKVKRGEMLVKVRDPSGQIFEVGRRNATDLVQHKGWSYDRDDAVTTDELATAGRKLRPRGEKLAAARELAAKQKAEGIEEEAPTEKVKKPRGRQKTVKVPDYDLESDDEPTPFDQAVADELDDELDALEAEEAARVPTGKE